LAWRPNTPLPSSQNPNCLSPDSPIFGGSVEVAVWSIDLDIDSDNNGSVDRSYFEDSIEFSAPGNLLLLNVDDDNGNGTPDLDDDFSTGGGIDYDLLAMFLVSLVISASSS